MPKLDLAAVPATNVTGYPDPYNAPMGKRWYRKLAAAAGIADFGFTHVRLEPGGISSQRHWHEGEDELVVMIAGEAVLVDDTGRTLLGSGDLAVFPKNDGNGHHLVNESAGECVFVAIGRAAASPCHYPDCDMLLTGDARGFVHADGTPYEHRS